MRRSFCVAVRLGRLGAAVFRAAGFLGAPKMNFIACEAVACGPGSVAVRLPGGAVIEVEAHGDGVALGRAALLEPEFAAKIAADEADQIETSAKGRLDELDLPPGLVEWYTTTGRDILPPLAGIDEYTP